MQVFDPVQTAATSMDVLAVSALPATAWQVRQRQRLQRLLAGAARHSRLYRALWPAEAAQGADLRSLPVVNKPMLMAGFDDWVTDPLLRLDELQAFTASPDHIARPFAGRYIVWESSGSSGVPGMFVQDAGAMAVYDALEALRRPRGRPSHGWWNPWAACERLAFVGATEGHFASTVSMQRLRQLNPMVAMLSCTLSFLQPVAALARQLQDFNPAILVTYPSYACLLADEAAAGRLRLSLSEIWTGGEALSDAQHHHLSQSFGCPVTNSYGASEFLALAAQCANGHLHLNADWAIVESVDEHHRPVPAGTTGATCLLTNLANHVQPLIRYDLGDRITVDPSACGCGSSLPVIRVEGRLDDALVLRGPQGQSVRLAPLMLTTVLEDDGGVFDFQLVQRAADALALTVAGEGDGGQAALASARDALLGFLGRQGLPNVKVKAALGPRAPCGRTGKIRRVVAL